MQVILTENSCQRGMNGELSGENTYLLWEPKICLQC
jgi:hypothetical protein